MVVRRKSEVSKETLAELMTQRAGSEKTDNWKKWIRRIIRGANADQLKEIEKLIDKKLKR